MNKATAKAYNSRLGYFDSFVSNDYRISLDVMIEQIKKGRQDSYEILNLVQNGPLAYCLFADRPVTTLVKVITSKTKLLISFSG